MNTRLLPIFPLNSVLVPHQELSLHIFEPRYLQLVEDCLANGAEFGVVLIERGHEVGGGDARASMGTVAKIFELGQFPDGRYQLLAAGTQRFKVAEWLPDNPYAQALVDEFDDHKAGPDGVELYTQAITAMREYLRALVSQGHQVDPDVKIAGDLVIGGYDMINATPLGDLDRFTATYATSPEARFTLLTEMFHDGLAATQF